MKSPITIDFVNSIIIVNAAYAKKASNPFSEEYEQLQRVRADYPTYAVITRTIKKNSEKESYNGIYTSQIDYLNSLVCKSLEKETVSLFELYNTNLIRYKEQDAESIFKSDF